MAVLLRGGGGQFDFVVTKGFNLEWLGRYIGNLCDLMKATLHEGRERGRADAAFIHCFSHDILLGQLDP